MPDDPTQNFTVWLFRPKGWEDGDAGRKQPGKFQEPAEAADFAEAILQLDGARGQSYCELRFNGDKKPHTIICFMPNGHFGIWNTDHVKWPVFYPDVGPDGILDDFPFEMAEDGAMWNASDDSDSKQKSEDTGNMKLDEVEDNADDEMEDDYDSDEDTEDEPVSEDDEPEDDFTDDDEEDDSAADDDEGGEDEGEEEDDEDTDAEDDEDDEQDDSEEDFSDEEEDGEDGEKDDEEREEPRLTIFGKFRGPKGWRKRAEAEELQERNTFALKLGILDSEGDKPSDQERETFAEIVFIESDEDRTGGVLRMKLPEGVEFSEPTKAGWITARIPYRQED